MMAALTMRIVQIWAKSTVMDGAAASSLTGGWLAPASPGTHCSAGMVATSLGGTHPRVDMVGGWLHSIEKNLHVSMGSVTTGRFRVFSWAAGACSGF
jgi:hypothetical protein